MMFSRHSVADSTRLRPSTRCEVASGDDGETVITIHGDLDYTGVAEIGDAVRFAVKMTNGRVVIDCAEMGFVDSSGLRLLVEAESMAVSEGDPFVLRTPPNTLRAVLRISGLDEIMEIVP